MGFETSTLWLLVLRKLLLLLTHTFRNPQVAADAGGGKLLIRWCCSEPQQDLVFVSETSGEESSERVESV